MTEVIKWDSDRFVIKQFIDTGAVYIYDLIENVGYVNQTETARLAECKESALSGFTKKVPKDLKALTGKDFIGFTEIQNPTSSTPESLENFLFTKIQIY